MDSVTIPLSTEILFALLSYLLSECMDFFDRDKKNLNKKIDSLIEHIFSYFYYLIYLYFI